MGKIYISYRRGDSSITAGKIYDRLEHFYGQGSLFMEIDPVPINDDYHQRIKKKVINSDVVLVVIGPSWLSRLHENADTPDDSVRLEIEAALQHNIPITPIFLGSRVNSLKASDLQEPLSRLSEMNGIVVDPGMDFRIDMDRLKRNLDEHFDPLDRNTGSASSALDGSESSQEYDIANDTEAVISSMGADDRDADDREADTGEADAGYSASSNAKTAESSLQDSILESWDDEANAQPDGMEGASDPDATRSNSSSNRSEPEVEFDDGEASMEWDDILSDLENDFGPVLSEAERLEAERGQFADSEGKIELEFELHDLEEDDRVGPEANDSEDNDTEATGQVDLPGRPIDDTLILNIDALPKSEPPVLNPNKVTVGGTLVLNADELLEEGISDPEDQDRFLQQDAPKLVPEDNLQVASNRRSQEKTKPGGKPERQKKNAKKTYAVMATTIIAIVLGWWFWSDHSGNGEIMGQGHTKKLSVSGTKSAFVENETAGKLLILTGFVHNRSSLSQKLIQLEGSAYAKGEVLAVTESAYAGRAVSDRELKTLPLVKIRNRLVDATGREAEISVGPERSLPFMIVLGKLPDDLEAFTVRIARSSVAE